MKFYFMIVGIFENCPLFKNSKYHEILFHHMWWNKISRIFLLLAPYQAMEISRWFIYYSTIMQYILRVPNKDVNFKNHN